ncbi:MAG: hypothetical protein A2521_01820 [Deltaproteobacteria bacterium RIFOXYD12_FULL_57_12]|nr:MAG: hypothetical protein A2521_01820 [Deltaproteobacteria bacterium RIFOXYD12_FULL_57_12]
MIDKLPKKSMKLPSEDLFSCGFYALWYYCAPLTKHLSFIHISLVILLITAAPLHAAQNLVAMPVATPPVVDGVGNDRAWKYGTPIQTHDSIADIDFIMTAVYTDTEIFFRVVFSDPDESRTHKSWVWDRERNLYRVGDDREDMFIFKWNLEERQVDLSIYGDDAYRADIWHWKACRTDPAGFADDNFQLLGNTRTNDSIDLKSKSGRVNYLLRQEDGGQPAYTTNLVVEYQGENVPRYTNQVPSGSRADVEAKGRWENGMWIIEFARLLHTGHSDDIQFALTKTYQFGVSRYDIAGLPKNIRINQPLYGRGDTSELLTLTFGKRASEQQ